MDMAMTQILFILQKVEKINMPADCKYPCTSIMQSPIRYVVVDGDGLVRMLQTPVFAVIYNQASPCKTPVQIKDKLIHNRNGPDENLPVSNSPDISVIQ
jgi:hypothetical protein